MPYNLLKSHVADFLSQSLTEKGYAVAADAIAQDIELCPSTQNEQFAFKTFRVAKLMGQNPKDAAPVLAGILEAAPFMAELAAVGPYLNFSLKSEDALPFLQQRLEGNGLKKVAAAKAQTYVVEHSQPNTHKELHVGHTRNSVLGDTLCRLLRHAGHKVHAENYHGDEGAHVAKCIWYMVKHKLTPDAGVNKGTWLGKIYVLSNTALEEANPEEQAVIKGEISEVLKQIEAREGHYYDTWKETRAWSLELFYEMYDWLGVSFDTDRCESDVSDESFKVVDEYYKKGVFIKSEGAIGADLTEKKLGFCMLLKSDGRGLYATKDIALALTRFREYHPDSAIYVVDNRQSHHFNQVFGTLDVMGFKEAEKCYHLAYEMVETKDGAMSSRKGNIVPLLELVDKMSTTAFAILQERYQNEWSEQELKDAARKISVSAIRYGMIRVDPDSKIVFDMESWLNLEGNTGPYLQYVYARMQSLLRKAEAADKSATPDWSKLTKLSEKQLVSLMSCFDETVNTACEKQKPNQFAAYTYELARGFNAFYAEAPIVAEKDEATRVARIALVKLAADYLGHALDLLGIARIERM